MWKSRLAIRWPGPFFLFPVAMLDRVGGYCLRQSSNRCKKALYRSKWVRRPVHLDSMVARPDVQAFSQNSRTPTVAKEFQIGLYDPAEADLELFSNC